MQVYLPCVMVGIRPSGAFRSLQPRSCSHRSAPLCGLAVSVFLVGATGEFPSDVGFIPFGTFLERTCAGAREGAQEIGRMKQNSC